MRMAVSTRVLRFRPELTGKTNFGSVKPAILGMEVTTTYKEILPNVALFDEIRSVQPLPSTYGIEALIGAIAFLSWRAAHFSFPSTFRLPGASPRPPAA